MAQLSRPFQIALAAVVLLAGVALFALKGGSSNNASSGSGAPAPAAAQPAAASHSGPTAPGVAGLTHAVEKAHGAVATSQQNASQLEQKSQEASSNAAQTAGGTSAPAASAASGSGSAATKASTKSAASAPSNPATTHRRKHHAASGAKQHAVEAELKAGDVVVILFWDHKGSDDIAVHGVIAKLAGHRVAVHSATAGQVAEYGSVTRGVQVYGTPTTLVISPKTRHAEVLTGLTDEFSLRQAISEARKG